MRGLAAVICVLVARGAPTVDAELVQFLVGKIAGVLESTTRKSTTEIGLAEQTTSRRGGARLAEPRLAARLSAVASEMGAIASEVEELELKASEGAVGSTAITEGSAGSRGVDGRSAEELKLLQSILAKIETRSE